MNLSNLFINVRTLLHRSQKLASCYEVEVLNF